MRKFDEAAQRTLVAEWLSSCLTQAEFAASRGCSPRALRSYIAKHGSTQRPQARVRAIIQRAMRDLQAHLDALDAAEARQAGSDEPPTTDDMKHEGERHADSADAPAVLAPAETAQAPDAKSTVRPKRANFFAGYV